DDVSWKAVKAALGAQHAGTAAAAPTVLVSQNPAELMLLNGAAAYKPVMGTRLERVSNTESNVFRVAATGTVYPLRLHAGSMACAAVPPPVPTAERARRPGTTPVPAVMPVALRRGDRGRACGAAQA